ALFLLLFRRPFLQQRLCRLFLRVLFSVHALAHVWLLKSQADSEASSVSPLPSRVCQAPWRSEWLVYSAKAIGAPPPVGTLAHRGGRRVANGGRKISLSM